MTDQIDEFESMFRRAERQPFVYADVPVHSVAVVGDLHHTDLAAVRQRLQEFVPRLKDADNWRFITANDYQSVTDLLAVLDQQQLDLVVTWRHLGEARGIPPFSLGSVLDVLTQATTIPVMVLPDSPDSRWLHAGNDCNRVMVVTDHISGDQRLVNYGARFCSLGGTVWLTHIEDEQVLERYLDAIERIPQIVSAEAREWITAQLLKDAHDYITTCSNVLRDDGPNLASREVVRCGKLLRVLQELIDEQEIDLLIANTKDAGQMAMHGVAHSMAVEFVDVALLLL